MSGDPHALKLYIDGSAYNNPGGSGGIACFAEFPEAWERPDEEVFSVGFYETTNNRMELQGCIRALEYVKAKGSAIGVQRVQIVTDSLYVHDNQRMPAAWRKNGWKTSNGRPVENPDLWKKFLSVRSGCSVRIDIIWQKGKKSTILKSVDRVAKQVAKVPSKCDRGFRGGKIGRSKVKGGSSSLYPAKGQEAVIRIYRTSLIRKTGHKVIFNVFDEIRGEYEEKYKAYVGDDMINELHRGHCYRVLFDTDSECPTILSILDEVTPPVAPSFCISEGSP